MNTSQSNDARLLRAPRRVLYLLTDELSSVLVRGQLGYLVGHGFDVMVATGGVGDAEADRWDPGVGVERLPFVREPHPVHDLRAVGATVRLIRRLRPDTVNASTPKAGLIGMVGAWLARVPTRIYVVRGLRFETATGWRRQVYRVSERVAIAAATTVVFNSRSLMHVAERERLIEAGRGIVLGAGSGNGVDVGRFARDRPADREEARAQLGLPVDAPVIGFVGRFTRDKGIADLIEAFSLVVENRPDTRLLLVGTFERGDAIAADVRAIIDSDPHIVVVPWLDDPRSAYEAMDVFAFPSAREGLPNTVLEAQLCAVPVVAYSATGTVDALVDGVTGVLVPHGSVTAMAEELLRLIDDPRRRAAFGHSGAQWVLSNFDQERIWAELAELVGPTIGTAGTVRGQRMDRTADGST